MPFGDRGTVTLSSAKDYSLIVFSWRILFMPHPSSQFSLTGFLSIPIFTLLSAEHPGRQRITPPLKGDSANSPQFQHFFPLSSGTGVSYSWNF